MRRTAVPGSRLKALLESDNNRLRHLAIKAKLGDKEAKLKLQLLIDLGLIS